MPADGQLPAVQVDAHRGGQGAVPIQAQLQLQHTQAQCREAGGHRHLWAQGREEARTTAWASVLDAGLGF